MLEVKKTLLQIDVNICDYLMKVNQGKDANLNILVNEMLILKTEQREKFQELLTEISELCIEGISNYFILNFNQKESEET